MSRLSTSAPDLFLTLQSSSCTSASEGVRSAPPVRRVSCMPSQLPPSVNMTHTQQPPLTVLQGRAQRHPAAQPPTPAPPRSDAMVSCPQRIACPPTPVPYGYSRFEPAELAQVSPPGLHSLLKYFTLLQSWCFWHLVKY